MEYFVKELEFADSIAYTLDAKCGSVEGFFNVDDYSVTDNGIEIFYESNVFRINKGWKTFAKDGEGWTIDYGDETICVSIA